MQTHAPANRGHRHPHKKHHRKLVQHPINSVHFAMAMIGFDRLYKIAENTEALRKAEMQARYQKRQQELAQLRNTQALRHNQALDLIGAN